ncbi:MAG TPA: glycosyltransferase, partial [Ignavibacteria bacterium]
RKNLINILKAYRTSGLYKDYKFLIAGFPSMGFEEINAAIVNNNLQNDVIISGYVPDDVLPVLYENSAGLVFPTYYEGFGISIIEAMELKIPVLAGNTGAAPEIAKGYAVLVSPFSVGEIAEGMKIMLDVSMDNIQSAYEYSKKFTWEKTAHETAEFYKDVLSY